MSTFTLPGVQRQSISEFVPDQQFNNIVRFTPDFSQALDRLDLAFSEVDKASENLIKPVDALDADKSRVQNIQDAFNDRLDDIVVSDLNPFAQRRAVSELSRQYSKVNRDIFRQVAQNRQIWQQKKAQTDAMVANGKLTSDDANALLEEDMRQYRNLVAQQASEDINTIVHPELKTSTYATFVDGVSAVNEIIKGWAADAKGWDVIDMKPTGNGYTVVNKTTNKQEFIDAEDIEPYIRAALQQNPGLEAFYRQKGLIETFNKSKDDIIDIIANRSNVNPSELASKDKQELVDMLQEGTWQSAINDFTKLGTEKTAFDRTLQAKGVNGFRTSTSSGNKANNTAIANRAFLINGAEAHNKAVKDNINTIPKPQEVGDIIGAGGTSPFSRDIKRNEIYKSSYTQLVDKAKLNIANTGKAVEDGSINAELDRMYPGLRNIYEVTFGETDGTQTTFDGYITELSSQGDEGIKKAKEFETKVLKRYENMMKANSSFQANKITATPQTVATYENFFGLRGDNLERPNLSSNLESTWIDLSTGEKLSLEGAFDKTMGKSTGDASAEDIVAFKKNMQVTQGFTMPNQDLGMGVEISVGDKRYLVEIPIQANKVLSEPMKKLQSVIQNPIADSAFFNTQEIQWINPNNVNGKIFKPIGMVVNKMDLGFDKTNDKFNGFTIGVGEGDKALITYSDGVSQIDVPIPVDKVRQMWIDNGRLVDAWSYNRR
jgi:hypothetical protein